MIADEKFERNNQPDQKKEDFLMLEEELNQFGVSNECNIKPVSYTHLTLPTILLV